jgi:hypothetical protein
LRLSHLGAWYDRQGIGVAAFDPTKYDPNAPLDALSGVLWHARDSNTPLSGAKTQSIFWAPRVGAAWDVQGTGKTVVRGGYGMFVYHDEQGPFSGMLDVPAGFRSSSVTGLLLKDIPAVQPAFVKTSVVAIDPHDDREPRTQSWSLTVQRRIPWNMTYETSYVGSKSDHLRNDGLSDINIQPYGAGFNGGNADAARPFQSYNSVQVTEHTLYSNYHSWQNLVSRQTGKFSFTAAYTLSKALGIRGSSQGQQIQPPSLDQLRQYAYGVLGNNRTHVLSFAYSWNLPEVKTGVTNAVLGNWQVSGISQFVSGAPLQVIGGAGNFRIDGTNAQGVTINSDNIMGSNAIPVMPILTCDPRGSGNTLVNANCFAAPAVGQIGNFVFPNATGPWYSDHDLSLFKNFPFGGNRKGQFRFSAYNVFNHPQRQPDDNTNLNLDFTNGVMTNKNFGVLPTDNKYGRRIIQLAFKFYF